MNARSTASTDPEALFATFLEGIDTGQDADFDELRTAHPECVDELERLHADWRGVASLLWQATPAQIVTNDDPAIDDASAVNSSGERARELWSVEASDSSRYQFRSVIGRGGMGAVLKVWDRQLNRPLAMKLVLGSAETLEVHKSLPVDARALSRFLEEAQITSQLDHPGIVPVHELGTDEHGRAYFTMRLVTGESLQSVIDHVHAGREDWTQLRALRVIVKLCETVAYAHSRNVIHRDIKPANVIVGRYGEVYLMDWGLARAVTTSRRHDAVMEPRASVHTLRRDLAQSHSDSPLFTRYGDVLGTPVYMSPEQALGQHDRVGIRSDVYAIGAVLYHLLCGQMPYVSPGSLRSSHAVWFAVTKGPPQDLHALAPRAPEELITIAQRAMARDPDRRYADVQELAGEIQAYLEGRVVPSHETGTWAETKKWVQRNKPFAAALVAFVVALAAGLVVSYLLKQRSDANRVIAETSERIAKEQEALAKLEKSNVFRLSALQTLDDLRSEADELWPAEPAKIELYRAWLARAERLMGRLPEFRRALVEIQTKSLPPTPEEQELGRTSHPRYPELEHAKAKQLWLERMLGEAAWPSESIVEAELAREVLPADTNAFNNLVMELVDPKKPVYGQEVKALVLARRVVAMATDEQRFGATDTLAWALFKLGRFDEALSTERQALEETEAARRHVFRPYVADLESAVDKWRSEGDLARRREFEAIGRDIVTLEAEVSHRRIWRFAQEDDAWWHAQMKKLVGALESFGDERTGLVRGSSAEHGWSVSRRLEFAESIDRHSRIGSEANARWTAAIEAICASQLYRDVRWPGGVLKPQLGLLPVGPDPRSGLWEFAHLQSGDVAERGADGSLLLTERTGIIFVLIPGGVFTMGAQSTDPTEPHHDRLAEPDELPVHQVVLSPYFLSKYEMTQGQWERFTTENPSEFSRTQYDEHWNRAKKSWTALHPVEQVSWFDCVRTLDRLGLTLPTEAQWENGARAGTSTVYSGGDEPETLERSGNVMDLYARMNGAGGSTSANELWDDGHTVHAEIGSYCPNPYGLHDMHGNVWEWCLDGYDPFYYHRSTGLDPVAPRALACVTRGGGFQNTASSARSATRGKNSAQDRRDSLGLRPAAPVR